MLDDRARLLLKVLIERYIAEGQPVGSRALSKVSGLDLSPATIRNVMADLEEQGYIASPHTSAGRVPTARGYRFFVDSLLVVKPLERGELDEMEGQLRPAEPERLIAHASSLLSELTHFAGVVVAPRRARPIIRHIEFLSLSEKRILLIIVTEDGEVQNRILFSDRRVEQNDLVAATNLFNEHFAGRTLEDIQARLKDEVKQLRADMIALMTAAVEAGSEVMQDTTTQYVVSGERHLLEVDDLSSNLDRLRELFGLFDQRSSLIWLLDLASRAEGVQIFIGQESGLAPLDECSVVAAPFDVEGQVVGTVGVIGPTRMAYSRVIPIVDITARLLSSALSSRH